ncbi:MAG: hypothetical protein IT380_06870 [Myxococcales bacterium]|nr:hypothetical protein [Myxococcales bacterium]
MKRTLLGLVLAAATMGATAARADDDCYGNTPSSYHPAAAVTSQRPPPPLIAPRQHGRYELRAVQRWVEGTTTQVWVEGRCVTKRHGRHGYAQHTRCLPGRYEAVTTPGHYEARQEWVWVAYSPPIRYGASWNNGQVTGGFEISMR